MPLSPNNDLTIFIYIILGMLVGSFFLLDVLFAEKTKKDFFIKSLLTLFTVSLPFLVSRLSFVKIEERQAFLFITLGIIVGIVLVFILTYFFYHKKKQKQILVIYHQVVNFNFLDLVLKGYKTYESEVEKEIKAAEKRQSTMLELLDIVNFLQKINIARESYRTDDDSLIDTNIKGYVNFLLSEFLSVFIGTNEARFSFREYVPDKDIMQCIITTQEREKKPTDIPLNKKNLITLSMRKKKPVFYRGNEKHHFDTKGSIKNGIYYDYVTYCLPTNSPKPQYSVCMDFKNTVKEKIYALVKSGVFEAMCKSIQDLRKR